MREQSAREFPVAEVGGEHDDAAAAGAGLGQVLPATNRGQQALGETTLPIGDDQVGEADGEVTEHIAGQRRARAGREVGPDAGQIRLDP